MQCPQCNWQNPSSFTECFNCRRPLLATTSAPAVAAPADLPRFDPELPAEPHRLTRFVATLIDFVALIAIAGLLIAASVWVSRVGGDSPWSSAVLLPLLLAIPLLPFILLGALDSAGGTPGKRWFGLEVRGPSGKRPGLVRATLRQLLKYLANLGLPFVFHWVDRIVFGEQGAHNVLTGSYVVRRHADPERIRRFIQSSEARGAGKRRLASGLSIGVTALLTALILATAIHSWVQDRQHPEIASARRAVNEIVRAFKPITQLATAHYTRTGRFAADAQELGLNAMPKGIAALSLDPRNGAIMATLAGDAGDTGDAGHARLLGKHLVWRPEFKQRKGETELKKWRCGSTDIPKAELPSPCNDDLSALAAPKAP
ncbi:RDD family protein [Diaphorobacter caeni]|uniref:RDD family protein n=1 Tax=Diaphorobacter caeni TaxID=2784387 RepID=UPI00188E4C63|nr:RDD family protein [Diaphorobacter caeni]MBF5002702.1 RDD family protein [Diaphorobacter caeni]